jgi:predicted acylesterase/phospholipase RssA
MKPLSLLYAFALLLLLSACASFPETPRLAEYNPDRGYRFDRLDPGDNSDELFVIVSFSGGGTRAAALSYGVLEALRDTRIELDGKRISLLQEVDVISSISGGSFTAAYYALKGEQTFNEFPDRFLYRPIQSELIKQAWSPGNWFKLAGSSYGRSDLAAEFYNDEVFNGATYADVVGQGRRPFVILNATDMSTGQQFPFTQDQFDLLCSDLSALPLARAAASSSAFPGLLTPLTFENHAGSCGYTQPEWVSLALDDHRLQLNARRTARAENRESYTRSGENRRDYIHLVDGGVADNIGLRGPLAAMKSTNHPWSVLQKLNNREIDRILVIVVNAATNPDTMRDDTPGVPGVFDTVSTAATVPLDNYSFDTVELLSAATREFTEDAKLLRSCKRLAAAKGEQCKLIIPEPHQVDLHAAQVAFDFIKAADERHWFKNLPTTFELPPETIDRLRGVGRELLHQDKAFQEFLSTVNGCLPTTDNPC